MGITKETKEKIKAMKRVGYTVAKISQVMDIPKNIIETICVDE